MSEPRYVPGEVAPPAPSRLAARASDAGAGRRDPGRGRPARRERRRARARHRGRPRTRATSIRWCCWPTSSWTRRRHPGTELSLERLTEWLAHETGRRYLRIDPTKVDVAAVTAVVSHAYARAPPHPAGRGQPRARADRHQRADRHWRWLRRPAAPAAPRDRTGRGQPAGPAPLHDGVLRRDALGARRARTRATSRRGGMPSFEQLVELGRAGEVGADDQHVVHIVDWLLQYAYEQRASDIHLEPRRDIGAHALPHRRRAAQGVRIAARR